MRHQTEHSYANQNPLAQGGIATGFINPAVHLGGSGLSEIIGTIRRRKWVLISSIIVVVILGVAALSQLTPRYTAEAMVLIEAQESNIAALESVVAGLPSDAASVQSEVYILTSRTLAHRVIDRLGIFSDPEFNDNPEAALVVSPSDPTESTALDPREAKVYHQVTENFEKKLSVKPQINSRVITVQFVSEDPEKARLITNTLLDVYILSRLEAKYESTKRANSWLTERIADLREQVEISESEVERLRQQYGLVEGNGVTLSSQELSEINAQLIMSRSSRVEAEARLRQLQTLLESPDGISTASEVLSSSLIQRLREKQSEIQRTIAELSSEYGVKHPRMIKLTAEYEDVSKNIANEVYKTIAGLENDATVARARERSLESSLDKLKVQVGEGNQNSIKVRMFEREAEANRALLATLLGRQKETLSQEDFDFQQADARVISYADIPTEPSFPNNTAIIAMLFVGSVFLGLFIILLLELLDHGVHSGEDLASQTGIPSLGFAPFSKAMRDAGTLSAYAAIRHTPFGQAIKTLNWSIRLGFPANQLPKTIMVTSSVPSEGKSTVAACMAFNAAVTNSKVLLIDADLRRPTLNKMAGVVNGPGLIGYLEGKAGFADVLVEHEQEGLTIIPAGSNNNFDSEGLMGSTLMTQLLDHASHHFDLIIVDTPPVMACADARILASSVDATVFVVRWASTKMSAVTNSLELLSSAGANFAGVFLSMVNLNKYSTYQYGDSGAYAGELSRYYAGSPEETSRQNSEDHKPEVQPA